MWEKIGVVSHLLTTEGRIRFLISRPAQCHSVHKTTWTYVELQDLVGNDRTSLVQFTTDVVDRVLRMNIDSLVSPSRGNHCLGQRKSK